MLKRGASRIEEKARENMEEEGLDDTEAKMWIANLNSKCVTYRGRLASCRVLDSLVRFNLIKHHYADADSGINECRHSKPSGLE